MEIIDYYVTVKDIDFWEEDSTLETVYSFIEFWDKCDTKNFEKDKSE